MPIGDRGDQVGGDRVDGRRTAEGHDATQVASQGLEDVHDSVLTPDGETPHDGPADEHRGRAERERLHDVRTAADSAVDVHVGVAAHRVDDVWEGVGSGEAAVDDAAPVVGHCHPADAGVDTSASVIAAQHTLDDHRQAAPLTEAREVVDRHARVEVGHRREQLVVVSWRSPGHVRQAQVRTGRRRTLVIAVRDGRAVDACHDGLVAGVARPLGESAGPSPVSQQVHLRPSGRTRRGRGDVLEGAAGHHRDHHDGPDPRCGSGGRPLAVVVDQALHRGRSDEHRADDACVDDARGGVDARHVTEDMWAQRESCPRREVGLFRDARPGAAVDVVSDHRVERRGGVRFERSQIHEAVSQASTGLEARGGPSWPGINSRRGGGARVVRGPARSAVHPASEVRGARVPGRGTAPYDAGPKRRVRATGSAQPGEARVAGFEHAAHALAPGHRRRAEDLMHALHVGPQWRVRGVGVHELGSNPHEFTGYSQ